ncbi:hypothetical protein L7F22_019766 [Adiantum nelumboides]|nr:hypothetical protein [Adiantum nelumboides]
MMASSSTSTMNILSERNLNSISLRSNSTIQGTIKPIPPPKPSHLSTAFTGTLNSDALKSYIKQQTQRQSVASTSTNQRYYRKNYVSSLHYAHDTFKTSRESSTDEEDEDENAAWGTARQTPSPIPNKPGLIDIFAPLTIPGGDSMNLDAKNSFTIRADPIGRSQGDAIQTNMNDVETPTKTRRSPSDTHEDDKQVATIKLGKNEALNLMLSERDEIVSQGIHLREGSGNTARQPSMICSSEEGTIRSREPSILSRLSTFEDDFDEETYQIPPNNDNESYSSNGVELESTPRKNWMHARDGSAFERASPCNGPKSGFTRIHGEKSKINVSQTSIKESDEADTKTGLPSQSRGLPMLVAGPPPIRPKSVALKVSDIEDQAKAAIEEENITSTPKQEKSQAECELHVTGNSLSANTQQVSELNVTQPNVSKSNLSSRRREVERGTGRQARALYEFEGEPRFNELSLAPGQVFEILKEDVQDGWSLAAAEQKNVWTKGLIPQGWYTYIQEFTVSPNVDPNSARTTESTGTSLVVPMIRSHSSISATSNSGNRDESHNIRSRQDSSRPASGVGQMSSSFAEGKGALQILTQMKQYTATSNPHPQSGFRAMSGSKIQDPIREASVEEVPPESIEFTSNDSIVSGISSNGLSDQQHLTANDVIADTSMETNISTETAISTSWKPPGIFGGRSLNRFAPFVTSGAEHYILTDPSGKKVIQPATEDNDHQFAITYGYHGGPAWKYEGVSLIVEVHSPEVHVDDHGKEYTAYVIHTSFVLASEEQAEVQDLLLDPFKRPEEPSMTSSVYRRFNQFRWLANHLCKYYPSIMLTFPPMPSTNQGAGRLARFDEIFVERRRRHLQSWLSCVVRHPSLSKDAGVRFFLEAEEEGEEWLQAAKRMVQKENQLFKYDQLNPTSHIFASTTHPMFNFEANEAELEAKHMTKFSEVYERCMSNNNNESSGMLNTYKGFRSNTTKSSESYRQLSLSILRLITGSDGGETASGNHTSNVNGSMIKSPSRMLSSNQGFLPPMGNVGKRGPSGATNEDRAWCWREGCQDCRRLTSAMQITAEAFQVVADDYQSHAEGSLFDVHDKMHNLAKAHQQQQPLLEIHRNALGMYRAATGERANEEGHLANHTVSQDTKSNTTSNEVIEPHLHSKLAEGMAIRSETVLNVTLSEMDRIHSQRVQDWNALSREMLDEQIAFYKDILHHLQIARSKVGEALGTSSSSRSTNHTATNSQTSNESSISTSASQARGPLLPSPYEVQLAHPIIQSALELPSMQLTEPSAASKAIRPVALAGEVLSDWLGGSSASRIV